MGHVPQDPLHPEGAGAHVQGRERGRAPAAGDLTSRPLRRPSLAGQARGRFGENEAARWYVRRGYRVVARNWRCTAGEIDLILVLPGAAGADVLVFCEVKARAGSEFGGPEGAVNWAKQRRLRRLAATWLAAEKPRGLVTVRFDVAAVVGARVQVIEAAF
ncbi:MAG: YraN family protein [Ilumatobacteraceae bacterium]|nr:YraN family protein [Ilumatobacteraceae bacterium]HAN37180.1 YraN family protein [Acidimicrobiaceae bacterium]HQY16374.1 YraN family protein [Ilumatobacteraceae bacterium]HQY84633.1 YraN family protein [Ilumatobacteraceae bacterium]HRA84438.1 YraN family protein [Ilumatobacteraceae bacterium]